MIHVEDLLLHLDGVISTGHCQWLAKCPAHDSDERTLSILKTPTDILIYDFRGCSLNKILAALELEPRDLIAVEAWYAPKLSPDPLDTARKVLAFGWLQRLAKIKQSPRQLRDERKAFLDLQAVGAETSQEVAYYNTMELYGR